jgi:hypothetical protein
MVWAASDVAWRTASLKRRVEMKKPASLVAANPLLAGPLPGGSDGRAVAGARE